MIANAWTAFVSLLPILVVGALIAIAAWIGSGHLRDLKDRAEAKRREHDRVDRLAALAAGDYAVRRQQCKWEAEVRRAFQQAMTDTNGPRIVDQINRIRQQIADNEAEREFRAELEDDEALASWLRGAS